MWTDGLWIIVMFLSDSHSDGTHSLQSIHCWDTDAETHSLNLMKKQTHLLGKIPLIHTMSFQTHKTPNEDIPE